MIVDAFKTLKTSWQILKNHSVQEFSSLQKKLDALIAILAKWITKDIMHPAKEELIDYALPEKAAAYP